MRKSAATLCVSVVGVMVCAALATSTPQGGKRPRRSPPFSSLICTNAVVDAYFHSYLRCRFAADESYGYLHTYVKVGDRICFENGSVLEITTTSYSYNGSTNSFPDNSMFGCVVTSTTIMTNACIWDCE